MLMLTQPFSIATGWHVQLPAARNPQDAHAMTQLAQLLTTNLHFQQASAAAIMQMSSTSRIILVENALPMSMIAYGLTETRKKAALEMQNGGATSMNGNNAMTLASAHQQMMG